MSIPLICRTATTQAAAASPSVAVSAASRSRDRCHTALCAMRHTSVPVDGGAVDPAGTAPPATASGLGPARRKRDPVVIVWLLSAVGTQLPSRASRHRVPVTGQRGENCCATCIGAERSR